MQEEKESCMQEEEGGLIRPCNCSIVRQEEEERKRYKRSKRYTSEFRFGSFGNKKLLFCASFCSFSENVFLCNNHGSCSVCGF